MKEKNYINLKKLLFKTFTKKTSYFLILLSFSIGLFSYTKRIINYELSSDILFIENGIESYLFCNNYNLTCVKDTQFNRISNVSFSQLNKLKNNGIIHKYSFDKNTLKILTNNENFKKTFKKYLIKIENKVIELEKNDLNEFFITLNSLKLKGLDNSSFIFRNTFIANNIKRNLANEGKIIIFGDIKTELVSRGYENIIIFTFLGLITSTFITYIRENFIKNNFHKNQTL